MERERISSDLAGIPLAASATQVPSATISSNKALVDKAFAN